MNILKGKGLKWNKVENIETNEYFESTRTEMN